MCEVTRKNFEEKYSEIIDDLHSASFISIDCEFSGLFDEETKYSLFDTPKVRFKKLQSSLQNYLIIQFGLSTFKYDRTTNTFAASTYNFYIVPTSIFKANSKFTCHINSLEFLCKHTFDFNTLFYDGINFLCKADEVEALQKIQDQSLINSEIGEEIQKYCLDVANWNDTATEGSKMTLEIKDEREPFIYILHQEIRRRFPNIWTYYESHNSMIVKKIKVSEKRDLKLNKDENLILEKKLFDSLLGFSRILKEIQNLRKPIVGHNFLIDLIMIYKQFYNPADISYKEFKENITNLFPNVYDTKYISFKLRDILPRETVWRSNSLSDLYQFLREGKGATVVLFTPKIIHKDDEFLNAIHFHEAGYDSYCTGFCFLKMAHIYSMWNEKKKSFGITAMPIPSSWLLNAVTPMKNCMNIARGQVNNIVLDGPDPKSTRPGLLYIQTKTKEPLDTQKLSQVISKYGTIDIQLLNKYSGLMAANNERQVQEIMGALKNDKQFIISKYSFLRHSDLGKTILPSFIIASLALLTVFLSKGNYTKSN